MAKVSLAIHPEDPSPFSDEAIWTGTEANLSSKFVLTDLAGTGFPYLRGSFSNENDENCSSTTEWKRFKDD